MEMYTLGIMALPVVIGFIAVAAVLTLAMGILAILKTLKSAQRFLQTMEKEQRPLFTINVINRKQSHNPPMREQD